MYPILAKVLPWLLAPILHRVARKIFFVILLLLALVAGALHLWGGPILLTILKWKVNEKTGADLQVGKSEVAFWSGRAVLDDFAIERADRISVKIPRVSIVSGPWRHLVGRKHIETITLERPSVRVVDDDKEKERDQVYVGISDLTITGAEIVVVDPTRAEALREIRLSKLTIEHARFNSLDHVSVLRTAKKIEGELVLAGSTGRIFVGDRDGKRVWEFGDVDLKAVEALWPDASKLPFSAGRADATVTFADGKATMKVVLRGAKPDKSKVSLTGLILSGLSAAMGSATYEFPIDYNPEQIRGSIGDALRKLWIAMGEGVLADILRRIR